MSRLYVVPVSGRRRQRDAAAADARATSASAASSRAGRAAFDWSPDGKTIVFAHTRTPRAGRLADRRPVAGRCRQRRRSGRWRTPAAAESSPLYLARRPVDRLSSPATIRRPGPATRRCTSCPRPAGTPRQLADTARRLRPLLGAGRLVGRRPASSTSPRSQGTSLQAADALPLRRAAGARSATRAMACRSGGVSLNASRTHVRLRLGNAAAAAGSVRQRRGPLRAGQRQPACNDDLATPPLGRTEVIRWKSTDGLEIEGLLTYPVGYEKGKRYPLLLVIHGGPMGVFTQSFDGDAGHVSGRGVRRAGLRGAAAQSARQQRLRQEVPLRQLRRLGRRRLSGPDDRRRSRHRPWASPTRTAWASWAGATAAS